MSDLKLHTGASGGLKDMGERFASAWKRASAGEPVNERHLSFATFQEAAALLTPKRLDVLREIYRSPAATVQELAERLGRNYKNVYGGVQALMLAGALDRDESGMWQADYDGVTIDLAIAL